MSVTGFRSAKPFHGLADYRQRHPSPTRDSGSAATCYPDAVPTPAPSRTARTAVEHRYVTYP
jgi:hypothetical protein